MPRANRFAKLKRPQNHEQKSGNNMNHGKNRMKRKHFVQCYKLRGSGIRRNRGRGITVSQNWTQVNNSTGGNGYADEREKNHRAPQHATEANSRLHTSYYAESATRLSAICGDIQVARNFSSGCQ